MKAVLAAVSLFAASAQAGTVLWNGIFNATTTTADFDKCKCTNLGGGFPPAAHLALVPRSLMHFGYFV
jgi:hypothetical protein